MSKPVRAENGHVEPAAQSTMLYVPEPQTLEEAGVPPEMLTELALKFLALQRSLTPADLAQRIGLPAYLAQEILEILRRNRLAETTPGGDGFGGARYGITEEGARRADEYQARNAYVGPAPVSLAAYRQVMEALQQYRPPLRPEDVRRALSHLVLSEEFLRQLGPAIWSGTSLFLYGAPGNGKSTIAEAIGEMVVGDVLMPHAIEIGGQIVRVFDPTVHQVVPEGPAEANSLFGTARVREDRRWVRIRRPLVVTGGELTLDRLDLAYEPSTGFYEAPLQVKANGGTLLIDDFGRQRIRAVDLLNRWIIPLEKRRDYLRLHTGEVFETPFSVLLIFSTNLQPSALMDEAFQRRLRYKVVVPDPTEDDFREMLQRYCAAKDVAYDEDTVEYLLDVHYEQARRPIRCCHARDIVNLIVEYCAFHDCSPELTPDLVDVAIHTYFTLDAGLEPSLATIG